MLGKPGEGGFRRFLNRMPTDAFQISRMPRCDEKAFLGMIEFAGENDRLRKSETAWKGATMGLFSFSMSKRKKHGAYGGSGYYGAPKQGFGGLMGVFSGSMSSSARKRMAYRQPVHPHPAQQAPMMHARPVAPVSACTRCGAQIPAGSKFCLECGQNVGGGFCSGCGAPLPTGARFCPSCGTPRA